MRKNLKSKVLLSLLAAGVFYLPACANAASLTISADTEGNPVYTATESEKTDWLHPADDDDSSNEIYYAGAEGTESITDNTIAINSSAFAANYPNVYGAFTNESGKTLSGNTIKAGNNNGITFTDDLFNGITFKLYGAYANIDDANNYQSTAEENSVTLNNISFTATGEADTEAAIIAGAGANLSGANKSNNSAELNKNYNYVAITGSTFNNNTDGRMLLISGAESEIDRSTSTVTATFNYNYVTINNSTVEGKYSFITGAYNRLQYVGSSNDTMRSKAKLTGNYVTIDGKSIIDLDGDSIISGAYNHVIGSKADSTLSNNTVNIGSAQFNGSADIHAALNIVTDISTTTANINGNAVNINNGAEFNGRTFISGATAKEKAYKKALIQNNTVNINGGTFSGNTKLFGAWGDFSNSYATFQDSHYDNDEEKPASPIVLQENQVNIKDGTFSGTTDIYGACADFSKAGSAKDNRKDPEGKTVALTGNNVTISGGTFTNTSNIYAAYAASKNDDDHTVTASLTDNSVTITGNAGGYIHDLSKVNLYGYDYNTKEIADKITAANNNLVIDGWSGKIGSINNFANIVYENVSGNMNLEAATVSGMDSSNSAVKINSIAGGDYATTDSDATTTLATITLSSNITNAISDTVLGDNLKGSTWIYGDYESAATTSATGGIYANKLSEINATLHNTENQITVDAKVDKTILAGTVIDAKGEKHINSNGNAALTVDGSLNNTNASVIAGAYAAGDNEATGGKVYMAGNYQGTVYAGFSESGKTGGNTAYISGGVNAASTTLLGTNKTDGTSGAALAVSGNGNTLKSTGRFDTITFKDVELNKAAALTVASADLTGTALEVASLAGGTQYHAGDKVALLDAAVITGTSNDITLADDIVQAGIAQELTVSAEQEGNSINLTVTGVGLAPQTNLVAQTRAASATFLNQGTDLINDSLDVLGRDGNYGVKTFAAVHGNRSKYDVADDIKINGWSTIVGVGNADKFDNGSELSWGVFYENGSGNYRTYNTFNNEFFRGDGNGLQRRRHCGKVRERQRRLYGRQPARRYVKNRNGQRPA